MHKISDTYTPLHTTTLRCSSPVTQQVDIIQCNRNGYAHFVRTLRSIHTAAAAF